MTWNDMWRGQDFERAGARTWGQGRYVGVRQIELSRGSKARICVSRLNRESGRCM